MASSMSSETAPIVQSGRRMEPGSCNYQKRQGIRFDVLTTWAIINGEIKVREKQRPETNGYIFL